MPIAGAPLIAEVGVAVVCGWFDEWHAADAAADPARRDEVAAAIAQGARLDDAERDRRSGRPGTLLRSYADAINGIDFDIDATPENISGALGCDHFG